MKAMQVASLILPTSYAAGTGTLASAETIADALEHTSIEFDTRYIQEKTIHVTAIEVVGAGVPGNLRAWVELSPYPTANSRVWPSPLPTSGNFWAAIGGGGGSLAPLVPHVEIGLGVNLTVHSFMMSWTIHAPFARLVIDTPAPLATAWWVVQALFSGKGG